jgi:hypothetical protein
LLRFAPVSSLLVSILFGSSYAKANVRTVDEMPIYDVVAVGVGRDEIVFATLAIPSGGLQWRFRTIHLSSNVPPIRAVQLSQGGTKALVVFNDGTERVLDLTEKIDRLEAHTAPAPKHRLPNQFFPVSRNNQTCLVDDAEEVVPSSCQDAVAAAVHEDGRTLYLLRDGTLSLTDRKRTDADPLPYRVPPSERSEVFAGRKGDSLDFLVLTQRAGKVKIIDPTRADGDVGTYDSWEVASMHALLAFSSRKTDASHHEITEETIRDLLASLAKEINSQSYEWSFFRVTPETSLYAPVLEFAKNEPALTSDTGIWNVLNPITTGTTKDDYRKAYDSLGQERWRRCATYFRVSSYPGSWLIEYWYYYPFDEGKPHPHIHDSEHLFVEVDKLGGTVRSVLAAGHNQLNPNNLYSTFLPGAQPVRLPLFAFAEYEKHAMCPDINRDGKFTRGVDENVYPEWYEVWGLRDLGARKGHLMEPYREEMSLPRSVEDRFALLEASSYFPGLEVDPQKATCQLLPFPEGNDCKDCALETVAAAESQLIGHVDSRKPENIYKSYVLPWYQLRIGIGLSEHEGNWDQMYAAYVTDLGHLTNRRLRYPSRLALEVMWSPTPQFHTRSFTGQPVTTELSNETYFGARFEQLLTNTQGFYFGVDPLFRQSAIDRVNGQKVQSAPQWEYEGTWLRFGYLLELPLRKYGNMTHYVGISILDPSTFRFEWRVGFGFLRRRGRDHFGIRATDPNPYQ